MILAEDDASIDSALAYYFECLDRGEAVDEAALLAKFPQHAAQLQTFLADQRALDAKVQLLRSSAGLTLPTANRLSVQCPDCHQPTEVAVDATLTDINCPACASRFSLIGPSAATNASPSLMSMGRFQLLERLGVGAYGSVWKARDEALDRAVAIKIPRQGGMTPKEQEKFFREARAAAQLRHPNIVSVHEVGRQGDSLYIVSDFVHGMTLHEWLDGHQLTVREAAELCMTIAGALHHAHEKGVIHRDLKPANIMMDADGRPHVMDFGLARRDAGEVTVTMDGQVLGTPAYMSPEQAEGNAHLADRRSDVYSLGVILYQLLTGELPFRGNARMLLHQVIHDEPPSPRKLNAHVPREMETIVGKAMEKRPTDRYASAKELADDLRRYLVGEPLKAKPASPLEKSVKWSRRHRTVVSIVAAALVLLTSVLAISFVLINKERVTALAALDETSQLLYMADMNAAYEAWDNGWADEAQAILARQKPIGSRPDQRGLEWYLLERLSRPPEAAVLAGHTGPVNEMAVFPDREHLASVGNDGALRIWDLKTKTSRTIPLANEPLHSVAISPDGRYVAAGSKTLFLCDLHESSPPRELYRAEHNFESLAFDSRGEHLAGGVRYQEIILFSLNGQIVKRVPCASRIETLELTRDSQWLLVDRRPLPDGSTYDVVQLRDKDIDKVKQEFTRPRHSPINIVRLSPAGKFAAISNPASATIDLLDMASGDSILETPRGRAGATALAWSPSGLTVAAGYSNGVFNFLDTRVVSDQRPTTLAPSRSIAGHDGMVADLEFIRDDVVATCGADGLVKIWDLSYFERTRVAHRLRRVHSFGLSPDGKLLACAGDIHFKLLDHHEPTQNADHFEGVSHISWSPSGRRVAACRENHGDVLVFDKSGALAMTIAHETPGVAAFSPDEKTLAVVGGRTLLICRADDGGEIYRRTLPDDAFSVAFSPDGRRLAYGGRDRSITITDSTGQHIKRQLTTNIETGALAFSPDGRLLASGHGDSVIRLWSLPDGKLKAQLAKHARAVDNLAFSPDGRTLLSTSRDRSIRAWSVEQSRYYGVVLRVDPLHESDLAPGTGCDFSLSSDGRWFAVLYKDHVLGDTIELLELQTPPPSANNAWPR